MLYNVQGQSGDVSCFLFLPWVGGVRGGAPFQQSDSVVVELLFRVEISRSWKVKVNHGSWVLYNTPNVSLWWGWHWTWAAWCWPSADIVAGKIQTRSVWHDDYIYLSNYCSLSGFRMAPPLFQWIWNNIFIVSNLPHWDIPFCNNEWKSGGAIRKFIQYFFQSLALFWKNYFCVSWSWNWMIWCDDRDDCLYWSESR